MRSEPLNGILLRSACRIRTSTKRGEADRFEALRERLWKMREDARDGGQDYQILMPDSDNPHNRLSNWGNWLDQYGRFLAGDPPGAAKDADRIRQDRKRDGMGRRGEVR